MNDYKIIYRDSSGEDGIMFSRDIMFVVAEDVLCAIEEFEVEHKKDTIIDIIKL